MKLDGHVDPDLFEIFVRDHVFMDYANRFLDADKIDRIDWPKMPGISPELAAWMIETEPSSG